VIRKKKIEGKNFEVCLRISFLGVNKGGEEDRISNEENRSVIPNQIPIPLL